MKLPTIAAFGKLAQDVGSDIEQQNRSERLVEFSRLLVCLADSYQPANHLEGILYRTALKLDRKPVLADDMQALLREWADEIEQLSPTGRLLCETLYERSQNDRLALVMERLSQGQL